MGLRPQVCPRTERVTPEQHVGKGWYEQTRLFQDVRALFQFTLIRLTLYCCYPDKRAS